jgi:hypothetical protein
MPQDIFDAAAAPQQKQQAAQPAGGDIFDQVAAAPPSPSSPAPTGDVFDQLAPSAPSSQATQGAGGDDPARMGVGESVFTRPLTTYLGIPEYRQGAGGIERGVEKFASGLTSPLNLGLMLVTGGLGGVAEAGASTAATEAGEAVAEGGLSLAGKAGASVLSRLAPETAAKVATASGTIEKLANAGFTLNQLYDVAKSVPRISDAIKAGDTDTALEMVTSAALGSVAAALSAKHLIRDEAESPTWTRDKEVVGAAQQPVNIMNARAATFESNYADLIDNQATKDMPGLLYKEAGGREGEFAPAQAPGAAKQPNTIEQLKLWQKEVADDKNIQPQVRQRWIDYLEKAQNLPDDVKNLSTQLTGEYQRYWQDYKDKKIVREALPDGTSNEGRLNYAGPHIYDKDDTLTSSLLARSRQAITKTPQHLKPREFATAIDALKAGYEPTRGLAAAHAEYIRQVGQRLGHYQAEQSLLSERAPNDSMPLAVNPAQIRGVKEVIPEPGEGLGLIPGKTRTAVPVDSLDKLGKLDVDNIPPEKLFQGQDGKWYLDVSDYRDGPELFTRKRFKDTARDPNDSTAGIALTEPQPLKIHPDYVDTIKDTFENTSWFRKNPIMRTALAASSTAKSSLLSLSPFHWTTEYLRGLQMGLTPWEALNPPKLTEASRAVSAKFGARVLGGSSKARAGFEEGLGSEGGVMSKIPGVGKVLGDIENKLFGNNGYIDRLKGAAFDKVAKQLEEKNRNWSRDQVDMATSRIVDAAFGGLNYKMLGVSMASQDAARLFFLAPDFTGSQALFAKYALQPGGSVIAQSLGRIALYNFAAAQILNLLTTGQIHPEHPFGVVSSDDKNVWTVRTMPQDMLHAMTDPRGFIYNRLNPLIARTGAEAVLGRDSQGRKVDAQQEVHDLLRNILPIPGQALLPGFHPEGQTNLTQVARALGATAIPNRTSAEDTARELASGHTATGPVKPEQLERHQLVLDIENKLQDKTITPEALNQYVEQGKITKKDLGDIKTNMRESQLMGPTDARLYRYASRLPADELLKVWDVATPSEKKDLRPLMIKRAATYEKEALPSDPTYQRLKALFHGGS